MRIKKLELIGFKSFKDRTVIHFDRGITGIVGPNGCGKSNIVDALVWVMGEMSAKHLRGASMSDVIFAGAENYAPTGMAEVSLTLENDGGPFPAKYLRHTELMVTRRLHRNGESEYLINKEPARLRDIQEIFMDTGAGAKGFSIIEQGHIGKIITAKPEDRRSLIEEAAGITKFKVRKRESQRKLVSTEQNLVRLQDILSEQKRQLDSLQRQAQRAERYRGLKKELQEKEVLVSSKNFLVHNSDEEHLRAQVEQGHEQEVALAARLAQLEAELATQRLQATELEKEVEATSTENSQAQTAVQTLEFNVRELGLEIESARRNREMTGSLLEQSQARQIALRGEAEDVDGRLKDAAASADVVSVTYQERAAELSAIQVRISALDQQLTAERREMLTISQSEMQLDTRTQGLDEKIGEQEGRLEQLRSTGLELQTQKTDFEKRRRQTFDRLERERQMQLEIMHDVENFQVNHDILVKQVVEKQNELGICKDKLNEVSSRLYGLENLQSNLEGFDEGVKEVLMWRRTQTGGTQAEPRPVTDLVEVPERFELAMEAALGQRLQTLVVESGTLATDAIAFLKSGAKGRTGFLAPDWQRQDVSQALSALKTEAGVEAVLSEVVTIPEAHRALLHGFFNRIVVVDSIATALGLNAKSDGSLFTYVTLDGDCLSPDGILTGGSGASADSGLLRRGREIKELSQAREEGSSKLAIVKIELGKAEGQRHQVGEDMRNAQVKQVEKEVEVASLRKDLERAEQELNSCAVSVDRHQAELSREEAAQLRLTLERDELKVKLEEIRQKRAALEESVACSEAEYSAARTGVEGLQKQVTDLQIECASKHKDAESLRQRLEMVQRQLVDVEAQVQRMDHESAQSLQTVSTNQVLIEQRKIELENAIRHSEELRQQLAATRNRFEEVHAVMRTQESALSETNRQSLEFRGSLADATLKLEQVRMKVQYLVDQIHERYMLDLRLRAVEFAGVEIDVVTIEAEVIELKNKVARIGDVNLSSIEEYDDLNQRHTFLDQQYKDLIEAKAQLAKVIDRINRICSHRFKDTFEQVNERFLRVYPVLFGGGEARLILVEDLEDPSGELGIDIVARPPGKKLQNVSLLSGGEKALTAVALIFSIFLVKPSPFCLLDEVDAPLDDANVFRFNDLVKEMAKRSQIILVTHNKHTMRVNNTLYGVTMEEKGVSKMVSVNLDSDEAEAGISAEPLALEAAAAGAAEIG